MKTNVEFCNEIGINLNDFRRIKRSVELHTQVYEARDFRDLKDVLYGLIDNQYPCSVEQYSKVKDFLDTWMCEDD